MARKRLTMSQKIYREVLKAGKEGCTCSEIERVLRAKHQTVSARIREMCQTGCLCADLMKSRKRETVYRVGTLGIDAHTKKLTQLRKTIKPDPPETVRSEGMVMKDIYTSILSESERAFLELGQKYKYFLHAYRETGDIKTYEELTEIARLFTVYAERLP